MLLNTAILAGSGEVLHQHCGGVETSAERRDGKRTEDWREKSNSATVFGTRSEPS